MQFAFAARFRFAEALLIAVAVFLGASFVASPAAEAVAAMEADIIGFQEMETFAGGHYNRENVQQTFLEERFPEFRFSATGNPERFPNTQPIAYRADRLVPLDQGFFFFSETPELIYSDPWASSPFPPGEGRITSTGEFTFFRRSTIFSPRTPSR
jgi:hypothetical protein